MKTETMQMINGTEVCSSKRQANSYLDEERERDKDIKQEINKMRREIADDTTKNHKGLFWKMISSNIYI